MTPSMDEAAGRDGGGGRSAVRFTLVTILVAALLFALPWPSLTFVRQVRASAAFRGGTAIVGASTIGYTSPCDTDRRDLAAMVSDAIGRPVLDLSEQGQPLWRSINLAAIAGRYSGATDVVLPVEFSGLDVPTMPPYRDLLAYKAVNPHFPVFRWEGPAAASALVGEQPLHHREVAFDGESTRTLFPLEKRLLICPERTVLNRAFARSYYAWVYDAPTNAHQFDMIADLAHFLRDRGKTLHVALFPANFAFMEELDPGFVAPLRRRYAGVVAALAERGVPVLDLSGLLPSDDFSTRWCACPHFNQDGRRKVSAALAGMLGQPRAAGLSVRTP